MKKEIKQVVITPEYAGELLRMNINNRNVRQSKVDALCMFLEINLKNSEEKVRSFLEELFVADRVTNKTCLYVRKKLIRHKMKTEIIHRDDVLRYIVRAWNDFLLGKETTTIVSSSDAFKYVIPR